MSLPTCACPDCGAPLPPREGNPRPTSRFSDCLRACDPCGIGFSNASSNPVRIFREPSKNVPEEVRAGLDEVLSNGLNVRNRANKREKFGFWTSEDAVTWTVFVGLRHLGRLRRVGELLGLTVQQEPALLLWGVPVTPDGGVGAALRALLEERLVALGESQRSLSEPDVLLDFGDAGLAVIEVKHLSHGLHERGAKPYGLYTGGEAFMDPTLAADSRLYELARNWRVGYELAKGRPRRVALLGPERLFSGAEKSASLSLFQASLRQAGDARFLQVTWPSLLHSVPGLPKWLRDFAVERTLLRA